MDFICVAVEDGRALAVADQLRFPQIPARSPDISASRWQSDHAATGLIERFSKHKAAEIYRCFSIGWVQLLFLELGLFRKLIDLVGAEVCTIRPHNSAMIRDHFIEYT